MKPQPERNLHILQPGSPHEYRGNAVSPKLQKPGTGRSVRPLAATAERPELPQKITIDESWVEGNAFWKRFVDRAMLDVQGMPRRKGVTLSGGVSSSCSGVLRDCKIQLSRHSGGYGEQSKMELWYSPGENHIQCWYQRQRMNNVELELRRHEMHAAVAGRLLSAEQFADQIVNWMLAQVAGNGRNGHVG